VRPNSEISAGEVRETVKPTQVQAGSEVKTAGRCRERERKR